MKKKLISIALASALVQACGGGDEATNATLTGTFVDATVANIDYRTTSQSGTTNTAGEFTYHAGEVVTFSIGNLDFPSALAGEIITPLTLADAGTMYDQKAINIARLLQSLDTDNDPGNGITLPASDELPANGTIADFSVATADFEAAVSTALGVELDVTEATAQTHVLDTLNSISGGLIGSWILSASTDTDTPAGGVSFTFFADGTFSYAEFDGAEPNGIEAGTYSYNSDKQQVTFTLGTDLNGGGGLFDGNATLTAGVALLSNQATFSAEGNTYTFDLLDPIPIRRGGHLAHCRSQCNPDPDQHKRVPLRRDRRRCPERPGDGRLLT